MNIYSPYEIDMEKLSSVPTELEIFTHKFVGLPRNIKDIMLLTAPGFIWTLAQNYNLTEEQSGNISRIIRDILLGDLFAGDMSQTISERLELDQQTAQQIRDKLVKELFAPAIEDIKKIQREKFPDRVGQGSANTPRPAMPQPPAPPQMKNAPPVNQSNIIDLRNNL